MKREAEVVEQSRRVVMVGSEWMTSRAGGLNRYFTQLAGALTAELGTAVHAWAFGEPPAGLRSLGPHPSPLVQRLARVLRAVGDVRSEGAVVDVHFALYALPLVLLRRRSNHLVVHFHGPWADESSASGSAPRAAIATKRRIERYVYSAADAVVVLSDHFAALLRQKYGVPRERIHVVAPGVDAARFAGPSEVAPSATPPQVLCVRRLERRMGIDVLIAAWPGVKAAVPTAQLVIVGEGSEGSALRRQVLEADVGDSIHFPGRVDDVELARAYSHASLSVVPSTSLEGFGLIAWESLAAGTPVVVTDCGGLPEAVRGLDPTLVVRAGDPRALADRLVAALRGSAPSAEECRAHVATRTWKAAAQRHLALYHGLADR